jgi:hypothetical protein
MKPNELIKDMTEILIIDDVAKLKCKLRDLISKVENIGINN